SGIICRNFNLKKIAKTYNKYAQAVSVLTDKKFFKGSLSAIKGFSKYSDLPVLRKDFIIDEYDVFESRYLGADAILLIASILDTKHISQFIEKAKKLGMDAVVEVNNKRELNKVLNTSAEIILINNRNLNSFKINLNTTKKIIKEIPKKKRKKITVISASGINKRKDVKEFSGKTDALLVGTAFMESDNIETTFRMLCGLPLVKICGITNQTDAGNAIKAGASFLGFNFYRKSPRYMKPKNAAKIIKTVPSGIQSVGVFVNQEKSEVKKIKRICKLDLLQFHGKESPKYCAEFKNENIIKTIRVKNKNSLKLLRKFNTKFKLLDSFDENFYGGTGKIFDHSFTGKLNHNIFLAGGLNSKNVCRAIKTVNPFAVDVCSGVEKFPGKKDFVKIKQFVEAVKNVR
ncbi:phosphoribosylanthranilate isomerase, partial [Candidatus Micrarchaeota archaeon]|nr:phosphoribosylanthranilate isomerase [Candidatus Micrarchaeota archaeon]